jgi:hypothetical protein
LIETPVIHWHVSILIQKPAEPYQPNGLSCKEPERDFKTLPQLACSTASVSGYISLAS